MLRAATAPRTAPPVLISAERGSMAFDSSPFTVTSVIVEGVTEIAEKIGRLGPRGADLRLCHSNCICAIQGTLVIEGNALNEEQTTVLLEGKQVIAPLVARRKGEQRSP